MKWHYPTHENKKRSTSKKAGSTSISSDISDGLLAKQIIKEQTHSRMRHKMIEQEEHQPLLKNSFPAETVAICEVRYASAWE